MQNGMDSLPSLYKMSNRFHDICARFTREYSVEVDGKITILIRDGDAIEMKG